MVLVLHHLARVGHAELGDARSLASKSPFSATKITFAASSSIATSTAISSEFRRSVSPLPS